MKKQPVTTDQSRPAHPTTLNALLGQLRVLIQEARQQVLRAVDLVQIRTNWEIGRHIVEFEQAGAERAEYGEKSIPRLAESLTAEFGKGFDARNLRNMRAFYLVFPMWNALRTELSWTHYRTLLRVESESARHWYMREAAEQNWSTRALERQIGTLYYERLLISQDRGAVEQEATVHIASLSKNPREFVRDPVMLEFLGLAQAGKLLEADLEQALLDNLQAFLLELLDWQMLRRGRAVRDVAYFLSENLLPTERRAIEGELLTDYHRLLVEGGVSGYTLDDCLRDYRLALLQRFRALVSTIAVMPFTPAERQMHVDVLLPRNIAAILDNDAGALL